jgi:hypothetical protein
MFAAADFASRQEYRLTSNMAPLKIFLFFVGPYSRDRAPPGVGKWLRGLRLHTGSGALSAG